METLGDFICLCWTLLKARVLLLLANAEIAPLFLRLAELCGTSV